MTTRALQGFSPEAILEKISSSYSTVENDAYLISEELALSGFGEQLSIERPEPGETAVVSPIPGQLYQLQFDPASVEVIVSGNDLLFRFADGSEIRFKGLAGAAEGPGILPEQMDAPSGDALALEPPIFQIGGELIDAQLLVFLANALKGERLADAVETVAGEEVPDSGGISAEDPTLGNVPGLAAQGVIPGVSRGFGTPDPDGTGDDRDSNDQLRDDSLLFGDDAAGGTLRANPNNPDTDGDGTIVRESLGDQDGIDGVDPEFMPVAVNGNLISDDEFGDGGMGNPPIVSVEYQGGLGPATKSEGEDEVTIEGEEWKLSVDKESGDYTFELEDAFDHDADSDQAKGIFDYTIQNMPGDETDESKLTIRIDDDRPSAKPDTDTAEEGGSAITGNVVLGSGTDGNPSGADDFGVDGFGGITQFVHDGETYGPDSAPGGAVIRNDGTTIEIETGLGGRFQIDFSTGDYSYTAPSLDQVAASDELETFRYTVADGDGDESSADLTISVTDTTPVLVVGENVSDVPGQSTPHHVPTQSTEGEPRGEIDGVAGGDVLIGDVGGVDVVTRAANITFVLDSSGSMGDFEIDFDGQSILRIEALRIAVSEALQTLADTPGATVKVHLVSFSTGFLNDQTFQIVTDGIINQAALDAAQNFANSMVASGWTNYEAGLTTALNWLEGREAEKPLDGSDVQTQTVFISDGMPNRALDDLQNIINAGSRQDNLDQALGVDGSDETGGLQALGDLASVGIQIGTSGDLSTLDQLDSSGQATNIGTTQELIDTLINLNPLLDLTDTGGDRLNGFEGDDFIIGDSLFTDLLADEEDIPLPPGSGYEVIDVLAVDGFFDQDPGLTQSQEIIGFLRDPANLERFMFGREEEAGSDERLGGDDIIMAGDGADVIFGQEGNDVIDAGNGDDVISDGTGADVIIGGRGEDVIRLSDDGTGDQILYETLLDGSDRLEGFDPNSSALGGDLIDLSDLFDNTGFSGDDVSDALDGGFLEIVSLGADDTLVQVDADGGGDQWVSIVTLTDGISPDLLEDNILVV